MEWDLRNASDSFLPEEVHIPNVSEDEPWLFSLRTMRFLLPQFGRVGRHKMVADSASWETRSGGGGHVPKKQIRWNFLNAPIHLRLVTVIFLPISRVKHWVHGSELGKSIVDDIANMCRWFSVIFQRNWVLQSRIAVFFPAQWIMCFSVNPSLLSWGRIRLHYVYARNKRFLVCSSTSYCFTAQKEKLWRGIRTTFQKNNFCRGKSPRNFGQMTSEASMVASMIETNHSSISGD